MSDVEITAVRDAHRFDEAALEAYLQAHVEGFEGPLTVKQFEGGQSNPTFQLVTPNRTYVLRKQPPGELLPSAHQVDREYRVMHALWETDVPVPKMYCLCEDPSVIGTKFYVMEMVEGRLFTETVLPTLTKEERRAIYLDLARVMALLHNVDLEAVGLSDFGRPGNYIRVAPKKLDSNRAFGFDKLQQVKFLLMPAHQSLATDQLGNDHSRAKLLA